MPRDKDRKRIIRDRMKKTGESYTAARASVIGKQKTPASAAPRLADQAALAGMTRRESLGEDQPHVGGVGPGARRRRRRCDAARPASRRSCTTKHGAPTGGRRPSPSATSGSKGLRERGQRRDGSVRGDEEPDVRRAGQHAVPRVGVHDATRRRWLD